jgi:hypothetical protein
MNNPDHIFKSLEINFCVKILKFFMRIRNLFDSGSGMEKIWIRIRNTGCRIFFFFWSKLIHFGVGAHGLKATQEAQVFYVKPKVCVVVQGYLRNVVSGAQYHFVSRWSSVSSYVAATLVMIIFVSAHLPTLYLVGKYWLVQYAIRYRVPDPILP